MREPLTYDDLEATEGHRSPDAHRTLAESLLEWASVVHPDDEPSTAELLAEAGWHLDLAGDTDAAIAVFRRAAEAEGRPAVPDTRCSIAAVLLASGRPDEARAVADELRRTRPGVTDCTAMAEVFETADDLVQAARWTAIGLARVELATDDELDTGEVEQLLHTRSRIRTAQGLPPD
ncbi:hypothetical protein SAMN05660199_03209 [Klenkia soli]|uniref:Tetratricopeptide repeat-containing protein n=1 Tax=Klenkia soli TaxID=1052260 RepID=A0A1H0Q676_9ACTN|nr:tetratricopeptide repeat protein [Klenkia soli]SDP12206.1 hypothetical protein SAMN05660199_03209 [Klenkia soli]